MTAPAKGIPRYQPFDGMAIFRHGFRPFFFGAGVWALLAMLLWLPVFEGTVALPTAFDPVSWHAHEMLFGFVTAAIAGFLLTAIPNWTGRMPLQGVPLITLFGVWLTGRVAVMFSELAGGGVAALCDLAFLALLIAVVLREILAGRNWRNLPIPVALLGLLAANAMMHAGVMELAATGAYGRRLGIAVVVMLIGLIGGRVVPSFTRNWLAKRGETRLPARAGAFDHIAMGLTALGLAAWVILPDHVFSGWLLLAGGAAMTIRLARWAGHRTLAEPLVWSLHAGFAWVPIGLLLCGAGVMWPAEVPVTAGLHALTAGAFGLMVLAMMTRATLGHSGRALAADGASTAIYALAGLAAILRVAAAFVPDTSLLWASAACWVVAFGLFTLHYGRILLAR